VAAYRATIADVITVMYVLSQSCHGPACQFESYFRYLETLNDGELSFPGKVLSFQQSLPPPAPVLSSIHFELELGKSESPDSSASPLKSAISTTCSSLVFLHPPSSITDANGSCHPCQGPSYKVKIARCETVGARGFRWQSRLDKARVPQLWLFGCGWYVLSCVRAW